MNTATLIKKDNSYQIYGWDTFVTSTTKNQINFGNITYTKISDTVLDPVEMKNCLKSQNNYVKFKPQ